MRDYVDTVPAPPAPDTDTPIKKAPEGDPQRGPVREPWQEPDPPKKVNLPPEQPTPAIIVPPPANPMIS